RRGQEPATAPTSTTITVRTALPEVALWQPEARTKAGTLALTTTLPDAIGEQELILVASDRRGGVGVARERVRVSQPVHVDLGLPAQLIAGETVELPLFVSNHSGRDGQFEVELHGPGKAQTGKLAL